MELGLAVIFIVCVIIVVAIREGALAWLEPPPTLTEEEARKLVDEMIAVMNETAPKEESPIT